MARESMVSIRLVRATVETAERAGISSARFMHLAGLGLEQLEAAEGRVSHAEFYRVCELALDLIADPALGLHEGEAMSAGSFNIVAYLTAGAPSLRQALETLLQFQKLLGDQRRFALVDRGDSLVLQSLGFGDASARVRRFLAEVEMTGFHRMVRYFCADARPAEVCFEYPAPAYRAEYERIFAGAARFEHPFTGIVFDSAWMDARSLCGEQALHEDLRAAAERRVAQLERADGICWSCAALLSGARKRGQSRPEEYGTRSQRR